MQEEKKWSQICYGFKSVDDKHTVIDSLTLDVGAVTPLEFWMQYGQFYRAGANSAEALYLALSHTAIWDTYDVYYNSVCQEVIVVPQPGNEEDAFSLRLGLHHVENLVQLCLIRMTGMLEGLIK